MSSTATGTLGGAYDSGDLSVLEGALRIAHRAETHPSGVRRRLWAMAGVAGVGLALTGGVFGLLLSRGIPSHPPLGLLSAFALLVGVALVCAAVAGAALTLWSVLHYQRLLLTELRTDVFEMTGLLSGEDAFVVREDLARALAELQRALSRFQDGSRKDPGDHVETLLKQVEATAAALRDAMVSGRAGRGRA